MIPEPRFETLPEKQLIGKKLEMSFIKNRTMELWGSFMPRRQEVNQVPGSGLYSVEVFPEGFFEAFNPENTFEKWAAVEAKESTVPEGMEKLHIPSGKYAVFQYQGRASDAAPVYHYIFQTWFPASGYRLDARPHFALMGEKYKNNDPDSEEELWFPVKG